MYPSTTFEILDNSDITSIPVETVFNKPTFMAAITSDKGTEDYVMIEGTDFFDQFGNVISFARHGQPLLQAATAINSGARLFVKRVVATDSTLANVAIIAEVSTDAEGKCSIKYTTRTVEGMTSLDAAAVAIADAVALEVPAEGTTLYPLFCFADNGRGISAKKVRISPDVTSSKRSDVAKYVFNVIEGSNILENIGFAFEPDAVEGNLNVSLTSMIRTNSNQLKGMQYEVESEAFIAKVAEIALFTVEELSTMDVLFGKTKDGKSVSTIVIDTTGINLSDTVGQGLESGTNGLFGNSPITSDTYATEMAKVFNGEFSDKIYDLDNYQLDLIIDANYPAPVKRAIEEFVVFRGDCQFLRDLGTGLYSVETILAANEIGMKSREIATYHNSYDVIDPYSKKQITVTIGYSLSKLMPVHFNNGRTRPPAGLLYSFIISDAIEGTVNFIPVVTPSIDQKEILEDNRINYCAYYGDRLVMELLYTSQEKLTQLSFVNNMYAVQEIVKAVRSECPKTRYSFISGNDLEKYKQDVQRVLNRYTSNFEEITLEYGADPIREANKQFYAVISVKFKNFVQSEYFRLIALPTTTV